MLFFLIGYYINSSLLLVDLLVIVLIMIVIFLTYQFIFLVLIFLFFTRLDLATIFEFVLVYHDLFHMQILNSQLHSETLLYSLFDFLVWNI